MTDLFQLLLPTSTDDLTPELAETMPYVLTMIQGKPSFMVYKNTRLGRVLVNTKVDPAPPNVLNLEDTGGLFWPDVPKIPLAVIANAWSFFSDIFTSRKAEAIVLLALDENNQWHLVCPHQQVSQAGLTYDLQEDIPSNLIVMGSIHSHADFDAFHSGTDETDAHKHDGLHITIGNVDDDQPSFDVMIAFSRLTWKNIYTIEEFVDGDIKTLQRSTHYDPNWLNMVTETVHHLPTHRQTKHPNHLTTTTPNNRLFDYNYEHYDQIWDDYQHSPLWLRTYYSSDPQTAFQEINDDLEEITNAAQDRGITLTYNFTLTGDDATLLSPDTDLLPGPGEIPEYVQ